MSLLFASARRRAQKRSPKTLRLPLSLIAESLESRELLAFDPFQQAFDINPSQSSLSMQVGIFAVVEGSEVLLASLVEQSAGSLTTQLGGRILAGSSNGVDLQVYEGSYLDPVTQPGPFLPGNGPADLAGVIPNFLGVNIYGAVTNLIAGLGPKSTTVANDGSFTLTDLPLNVTSGELNYDGGFLLPPSSTSLTGNSAVYTVSGSLTQSGNQVTGVQLPVSGNFVLSTTVASLNNLTLNIHIDLIGNVVASASNIPGVAITASPDTLARGEDGTFTFQALDDSVPSNGAFTYEIDWNNDNVVDQTVAGGTSLTTTHAYTDVGNYTYQVRVVDNGSNTSPWNSNTVSVVTARTAPNPNNPSLTDLIIGGTSGDDFIIAGAGNIYDLYAGPNAVFYVNFNTSEIELFPSVTGRLISYLQGGEDVFNTVSVNLPQLIYGGEGSDVLFGSPGSDLLDGGNGDDILIGATDLATGGDTIIGGEGNDILWGSEADDSILGGNGRDWIVGSVSDLAGADTIFGGAGEDMIMSGFFLVEDEETVTTYMEEWVSNDTYSNRVNHLMGNLAGGLNVGTLQVGGNVFNDSSVDVVLGEGDQDFLFVDLQQDVASDIAIGETVFDL
jgi:Ca2+-binding RTX toxin-like protein